jgi:hypothetical protein
MFSVATSDRRDTLSQTLTLPVENASRLCIDLFVLLGMSEADAAASVWPLIDAESMGIPTHGLIRVPAYAKRLRLRSPRAPWMPPSRWPRKPASPMSAAAIPITAAR